MYALVAVLSAASSSTRALNRASGRICAPSGVDLPNLDYSWSQPGVPITSVVITKAGALSSTYPPATSSGGRKIRVSYSTAGYWKKRLTGDLPENLFRFQTTSTSCSYGTQDVLDRSATNPTRTINTGSLGYNYPFVEPFADSVIQLNQVNLVTAKIAGKIKDMSVDLSVMAGEARETRAMFVSIAQNVSRAIGYARKGKFGAAADALGMTKGQRSLANGWLLLNYGILPLIADLKGSVKALEKGLMAERYCLVSARDLYEDVVYSGSGEYSVKWVLKSEVSIRCKYLTVNPYTSTLASLGLTNPMTAGWELTKLSFVVDWLIGIGAWLGQIDAYFGKQFVGGSTTIYTEVTAGGLRKREGVTGNVTEKLEVARSYERASVKRDPLVSFPIAVLPGFQDPVGLSHVATATSLLVQLRKT